MDDRRCLELIATGDARAEQAVAVLHRRYQARFIGFLRHWPLSDEECWDVTQETWVKIVHTVEDEGLVAANPQGWFYTVLTHTAIDQVRRNDRRPRHVDLDDPAGADPGLSLGDLVLRHAESQELIDCMLKVLDELEQRSPDTYALLSRTVIEELPLEELARELDINHGALRQRLSSARKRLREQLARLCPDHLFSDPPRNRRP